MGRKGLEALAGGGKSGRDVEAGRRRKKIGASGVLGFGGGSPGGDFLSQFAARQVQGRESQPRPGAELRQRFQGAGRGARGARGASGGLFSRLYGADLG